MCFAKCLRIAYFTYLFKPSLQTHLQSPHRVQQALNIPLREQPQKCTTFLLLAFYPELLKTLAWNKSSLMDSQLQREGTHAHEDHPLTMEGGSDGQIFISETCFISLCRRSCDTGHKLLQWWPTHYIPVFSALSFEIHSFPYLFLDPALQYHFPKQHCMKAFVSGFASGRTSANTQSFHDHISLMGLQRGRLIESANIYMHKVI